MSHVAIGQKRGIQKLSLTSEMLSGSMMKQLSNLARRRRTSTTAFCITEADFRHITEMSPCPAPGLVQGQLRCPALVLVVGDDWIEDTVQLNLQLSLQVRR